MHEFKIEIYADALKQGFQNIKEKELILLSGKFGVSRKSHYSISREWINSC